MLVRSEKFRASKIMETRVRKTENISILMNHDTVEILGDGQVVTGVKAKNKTTGDVFDIPATGFFAAIGHKPNTDIFKDYLTLDETGYIVNIPGTSKQMWREFLWRVMLQIMCIVKRLRLLEQDVWLLWMPKDI